MVTSANSYADISNLAPIPQPSERDDANLRDPLLGRHVEALLCLAGSGCSRGDGRRE